MTTMRFRASRRARIVGDVRYALRYLPDLLAGVLLLGGALMLVPILAAMM